MPFISYFDCSRHCVNYRVGSTVFGRGDVEVLRRLRELPSPDVADWSAAERERRREVLSAMSGFRMCAMRTLDLGDGPSFWFPNYGQQFDLFPPKSPLVSKKSQRNQRISRDLQSVAFDRSATPPQARRGLIMPSEPRGQHCKIIALALALYLRGSVLPERASASSMSASSMSSINGGTSTSVEFALG